MNLIAIQFNDDRMRGGRAPQQGVETCYQRAMVLVSVFDIWDCMIRDYTAYNVYRVESREQRGRLPSPFLSDDAEEARLNHYPPYTGFASSARMLGDVKDAHQLVQRYLIRDIRERAGTRPHAPSNEGCLQAKSPHEALVTAGETGRRATPITPATVPLPATLH